MTFFEDFICICFLIFIVLYLTAIVSGLLVMAVMPILTIINGHVFLGVFLALTLWPILIALWGQK